MRGEWEFVKSVMEFGLNRERKGSERRRSRSCCCRKTCMCCVVLWCSVLGDSGPGGICWKLKQGGEAVRGEVL